MCEKIYHDEVDKVVGYFIVHAVLVSVNELWAYGFQRTLNLTVQIAFIHQPIDVLPER